MAKITLQRHASWFRPYDLAGKEVGGIVIYACGNILYETGQGWLEDNRADVHAITIEQPVKAVKVNLNRFDNFYVSKKKSYSNDSIYVLYINAQLENLDFGLSVEKLDFKTDTQKHYRTYVEIKGLQHTKQDNTQSRFLTVITTSRSENTSYGDKIKAATELLQKKKESVSTYEVEKCVEMYNKIRHIFEVTA